MFGGISFGGLGSGLDTGAIIDALLRVERIPINQLEARKETEQKKLSLLGTFRGHVDALRDKANELSKLSGFLSFNVAAGDDTAASFSADGNAVTGSHTLDVVRLARADRWALDPVLDPTTNLASADGQSLSFTYDGTAYSVPMQAATSSLNDVAAGVNGATNGAVSASVVNTGTSSNPSYQLVLAGSETGEDFRITGLTSSIAGLSVDGTAPDPTGLALSTNNLVVGVNAEAKIDGLTVQRSGNDFNDVIDGVTISLLREDPTLGVDVSTTFTVEADKDGIKARVKAFIDAYNGVVKFVNEQTTYSEEEGAGGELFGENSLRTMQSVIQGALFNQNPTAVSSDPDNFGTLRLLGIELQSDGMLKINDSDMDAKLDLDLSLFAETFVDSDGFDNAGATPGSPGFFTDTTADTGLADDLMRSIDRVVKSYQDAGGSFFKGIFDARTDTFNANIKLFDQQIEQREFRMERYEENLVQRFSALERVMAQLQSQGAFFGQGF